MTSFNLAAAIAHIYPNIKFSDEIQRDCTLQDDGSGPYIAYWGYAGGPQPSEAQLADAWAALQTAPTIKTWDGPGKFLAEFPLAEQATVESLVRQGDDYVAAFMRRLSMSTVIRSDSTLLAEAKVYFDSLPVPPISAETWAKVLG
jgi:hypothetical protein